MYQYWEDIASRKQMGADYAYMGTRFINTTENNAPEAYKEMIIEAGTKDVSYTAAVSGVAANFLTKSLKAAGLSDEDLEKKHKIDFGKELDTEHKAWKTIWSAGQGSAGIHDIQSTTDLIQQLKNEFKSALEQQAVLNHYQD